MTVSMDIALLILRVAIGLTLAGHGAQKLFGWFGGPGLVKVRQGFEKQGYQPVWLWVGLAVVGELGGGLSLALGFLTPLGAAGIFGAMVMATRSHWKNGFFAQKGGYEYALTLAIASLALGLSGSGSYSLDTLFAISLPEVSVFSVLAIAALLVDIVGIFISSRNNTLIHPQSAPKVS